MNRNLSFRARGHRALSDFRATKLALYRAQYLKVGGGISAPQAVSTPDPQYTEEARLARTQGKCILWLIVDDTGRPRNIRVVRGLGYGLDAKAVEAVQQWRFQPAMKDGKPVNVQISVEVGFHLF